MILPMMRMPSAKSDRSPNSLGAWYVSVRPPVRAREREEVPQHHVGRELLLRNQQWGIVLERFGMADQLLEE